MAVSIQSEKSGRANADKYKNILMSHLLLIFCIGDLCNCKMQVKKDVLRQKLSIHFVVV